MFSRQEVRCKTGLLKSRAHLVNIIHRTNSNALPSIFLIEFLPTIHERLAKLQSDHLNDNAQLPFISYSSSQIIFLFIRHK